MQVPEAILYNPICCDACRRQERSVSEVLVCCDHIFFKKPHNPFRERYLNHLLLLKISKVEDYQFFISKTSKRIPPSTVFSCLTSRINSFLGFVLT